MPINSYQPSLDGEQLIQEKDYSIIRIGAGIALVVLFLIWYAGVLGRVKRGPSDSRTVKVHPYWSEMINVPINKYVAVHRDDRKPFEICYWSQKLGECLSGSQSVKKEEWFGDVRASSFRIRGEEGFATVTIDR